MTRYYHDGVGVGRRLVVSALAECLFPFNRRKATAIEDMKQ